MKPRDYLDVARVPLSIEPQEFGPWKIERHFDRPEKMWRAYVGAPYQTVLRRWTDATMHLDGEIVMEDSRWELQKHLPIWLAARGRILITGLGLGCVVRGLLASPDVEHVDVVEIDAGIIRVIGPEFACNARCSIHHADALTWEPPSGATWNAAWHDLWKEGPGLQFLHANLIKKFAGAVPLACHGAWQFPRLVGRRLGLLGAPR